MKLICYCVTVSVKKSDCGRSYNHAATLSDCKHRGRTVAERKFCVNQSSHNVLCFFSAFQFSLGLSQYHPKPLFISMSILILVLLNMLVKNKDESSVTHAWQKGTGLARGYMCEC